ncbi:hypothetical protein OWR29_46895 [Actinoplanes sp. Pm04-4]|uniref:Uncharacterized protein n=1 Tax=Paractinoplanes pyxinae TaxID=2997416 RepID=A0ABT4BGE2_9ACTN|nr:hypothetical protein [Actinoplanes pyxinae]MCY1145579.1 hypothetical protein [Actinoplanes pyxinae]
MQLWTVSRTAVSTIAWKGLGAFPRIRLYTLANRRMFLDADALHGPPDGAETRMMDFTTATNQE